MFSFVQIYSAVIVLYFRAEPGDWLVAVPPFFLDLVDRRISREQSFPTAFILALLQFIKLIIWGMLYSEA
jgi:hypothetical protein